MKKKFITIFLTLAAALCLCLGLAGCDFSDSNSSGNSGQDTEKIPSQGTGQTPEQGDHVHTYTVDNVCSICGKKWEYTEEGLVYTLNEDQNTYSIAWDKETNLTDVVFPYGYNGKYVTATTGKSPFMDCNSLTSVVFPASITVLSGESFVNCSSLESVTFDGESQLIKIYGFGDCVSLKSIAIPASVTSIGAYAFMGCSSLESVTFDGESQLTSIDYDAFMDCISLRSIEIPKGVTSIGSRAFWGCSSLTSITIPESMTSMGRAFPYCFRVVEIWNYSDLEIAVGDFQNGEVGYYAKQVYITDEPSRQTLTDDGYLFYEDEADSYLIGYFGDETELTLPAKSPKGRNYQINQYAFYDCNKLASVTIPDSVTVIGWWAFYDCSSLTDIHYKGSYEKWKEICKASIPNQAVIHCTDGNYDADGNKIQ